MFTDDELLETLRLEKSLTESIQFIYRNYFESLRWFILNNQGNRKDAELVFQEVVISFVKAVQKKQYPAGTSIKIFLFALNKHTWVNELKKRNKNSKYKIKYDKMENKAELDVSQFIASREVMNEIFGIVESLDATCKKILLMFYFENLSMQTVLTNLEYENEQVVRTKKYKCLGQIQKSISATPSLNARLKSFFNG